MRMVGVEQGIYGADCGVPCSTEEKMEENRMAVLEVEESEVVVKVWLGLMALVCSAAAAKRAGRSRV
jgi:hypothetical protein